MLRLFYEVQRNFQLKLSEKAQGMVEYAIVIAFIAVIAAAVFMGEGSWSYLHTVETTYEKASDAVSQVRVP